MPVNFLKSVVNKKASEVRIKDFIHAAVGGFEKPRNLRAIHASDLTKESAEYCPREIALLQHLKVKRKDHYIPPTLQMTFDEGKDKQARLNNDWLRSRMVGDWKCSSCGDERQFCKAPKMCNRQGVHCHWVYCEVRFVHKVTKASGGMDALVDLGLSKLRLVECKIIGKDQFRALKAPLSEHKIRTQLYLKLIAESAHPQAAQVDTEQAHLLYILRGYGLKDPEGDITPLREFMVPRSDEAVQEYIGKAHALTYWREHPEAGFPFGVCSSALCSRALNCRVVKACFSGDYPAGITWLEDGVPVHIEASVIVNGEMVKEK